MSPRIACTLLCALALRAALAQQAPQDVATVQNYVGIWAVDCARQGTRLTVSVNALTLEADNGMELRTAAPMTAFSYFGKRQPPAGFDVALLGEARPSGLALLAMKDAAGPYLVFDADPALRQQFGKPALAGKFRRCP